MVARQHGITWRHDGESDRSRRDQRTVRRAGSTDPYAGTGSAGREDCRRHLGWCPRPSSISPGEKKRFWIRTPCLPTGSPPSDGKRTCLNASWTKKHGKSHYGYKFTVSVDRKHKFVRTWVADTASVHDSQHLEAAQDEWNRSAEIYADKGHVGAEREERLRERGYRPQIQRKAKQTAFCLSGAAGLAHYQGTRSSGACL